MGLACVGGTLGSFLWGEFSEWINLVLELGEERLTSWGGSGRAVLCVCPRLVGGQTSKKLTFGSIERRHGSPEFFPSA